MRYPEILAIRPEPAELAYDDQFTMLYALALGCGADAADLDFVCEKRLKALPTMVVLMRAASGEFIERAGIDYSRIVHGEQRLTLHRPLPPAGRMIGHARCLSVIDKGVAKGALLNVESTLFDAASGAHMAT